ALGRAVAALDEGLELHGEAQVAQDLLELLLFRIAPVDGVGIGFHHLAPLAQLAQEHPVIEMPAMGLAHRVIEVLHIDEYGKFLQEQLRFAVGGHFFWPPLHRCQGWRPAAGKAPTALRADFMPTPAWATVAPPLRSDE